jgi:hypothetical protein
MDRKTIEKEAQLCVEKVAENYYEDMMCHPDDYAEWMNPDDEDVCWLNAIELAKDDVGSNPTDFVDEELVEQMNEDDWDVFWEVFDKITWKTFANKSTLKAMGE